MEKPSGAIERLGAFDLVVTEPDAMIELTGSANRVLNSSAPERAQPKPLESAKTPFS